MKHTSVCMGTVLLMVLLAVPGMGFAAPVRVNDINVEAQGSLVKITISANQPLQFETFRSDAVGENYIVVDFLGSIYTALPTLLSVNKGAVEKVSLVRGDDEPLREAGQELYPLDFLAINLRDSDADYRVTQSKSVIDLEIGKSLPEQQPSVVSLSPPIVVAQNDSTGSESDERYENAASDTDGRTLRRRFGGNATVESAAADASSISSGKKSKRRGWSLFSRRARKQSSAPAKSVQASAVESFQREQPVPSARVAAQTNRVYTPTVEERSLIDRIVEETVREKEQTSDRIEQLSRELEKMKTELNLTREQKDGIEKKINDMLAKLDELKGLLDEEIRRRQALGEQVEDLVARRDAYVKAREHYEAMSRQLKDAQSQVMAMDNEAKTIKSQLDILEFAKRKSEMELQSSTATLTQVSDQLKLASREKENILTTIDDLNRKLEQLKQELDTALRKRERVVVTLEKLQKESAELEQLVGRMQSTARSKESELSELQQRDGKIKKALEQAVAEKFRAEEAQRNAQKEFEQAKQAVEAVLDIR